MILMLALILEGISSCHPTHKQSNHAFNDGFAIGSLADAKIDFLLINKAVDEINPGQHDEFRTSWRKPTRELTNLGRQG